MQIVQHYLGIETPLVERIGAVPADHRPIGLLDGVALMGDLHGHDGVAAAGQVDDQPGLESSDGVATWLHEHDAPEVSPCCGVRRRVRVDVERTDGCPDKSLEQILNVGGNVRS
jgi:hypothetical protein